MSDNTYGLERAMSLHLYFLFKKNLQDKWKQSYTGKLCKIMQIIMQYFRV